MRMLRLLAPILFLILAAQTLSTQSNPKLQIYILESSADTQSYDVPARLACIPGTYGPICGARGAETVNTYSIRVKGRIESSGAGIWLTCQILKKGDEKHCAKLPPGLHPAEAKGNDKIIVYGWPNPLYKGDFSKASKFEYRVGNRELDKDELDSTKK